MPRVLHLFNQFGALTERVFLDYTLGLSRSGFDLTAAYETLATGAPAVPFRQVALARVLVEPTGDVPAQMEQLAQHINDPARRELLDEPFDLVHGHFGPRILQGTAWLRRGTPMIVSIYGYDVGRLLSDSCWIERYHWAAERGAVFVALARFMEAKLLSLGLPSRSVRRIHLGIDLAEHVFEPLPAPATPRFVFIGRFVDKKGTDVLIDAMAHLTGSLQTPAMLDLIGGGPNEHQLREQGNRLGLQDRIRFVGVIPFKKLFDHLHDCTALVQPSVTAPDGDAEGAPMVLMTAQASGVPCITTRHSGNPETLPPSGQRFVVDDRNHVALAEAMRAMMDLSSIDRRALQEEGREWIARHFNLETTVREYGMLYREMAPDCVD